MNSKTNIRTATVLAVACSALLGCSPPTKPTPGRAAQIAALNAEYGTAVTNTAQAYFRLGVSAGDNVNLHRKLAGKPEISGEALWREAVEVAGKDPYLKAP